MWKINLRDHGRIATGTYANHCAGQREQLVGIRRTVVRSHYENQVKKKRDEMSEQTFPCADIYVVRELNARFQS
jgi:hypothetical protein